MQCYYESFEVRKAMVVVRASRRVVNRVIKRVIPAATHPNKSRPWLKAWPFCGQDCGITDRPFSLVSFQGKVLF